jgi:3-deoxy-7-phosphoheptulonate synthase
MIESFIHEGRQDVPPEGPSGLKYGVSMCVVDLVGGSTDSARRTDACVDFPTTLTMLADLDKAVEARAKASGPNGVQ